MWASLHNHSQYSILDGAIPVQKLAQKAAQEQCAAIALTDHGALYGAVEFYKACKEVKVKPLIGCELYVGPESRLDRKREYNSRSPYHLTLIAKNKAGYQNLCQLSSIGFLEGFYYHPRIDLEILQKHSEGLICLSGCSNSHLSRTIIQGKEEDIRNTVLFYRELFKDDYYFELQRHPMSEDDLRSHGLHQESWLIQLYQDYIQKQNLVNSRLIELSKEYGIKLVATQNAHYLEKDDYKAHEILLNIQSGEPVEIIEKDSYGNIKQRSPNPKRKVFPSHEFYFKSYEEMKNLFHDVPEALANTLEVQEKCSLELDFKTKHYPVYKAPDNLTSEAYLKKLCEEGIPHRYTKERLDKVKEFFPDKDPLVVVQERLEYELSVIQPKGMSDYLLIVWDFINWAKKNGIPMGPGRGSGAGSIVLYLIGVTDIEPIRFSLFFERFINPERISYPDIDVDICMDRRSDVINYTLNKYGKDNVAQIITFGTMKAKMVIRDVGRVLNVPLSKVNEIVKLVPEDLNITLEKALEKDPDLKRMVESDDEARRIFDLGKTLEGSIRNTGIHAAGIIISGDPLTEHIPICVAKDADMPVTQYSMKPVEMVGMLKVDFLGLKTLTAIQMAVDSINLRYNRLIDWVNLPLDDKAAFELLNQGKTLGVFQLESGGMQELSCKLHLDKFEEIIAVGALYRPGPMDMIPSFINRKHGREAIDYDHPWMEEILAETYGIMVYQEQVMQIAQKLANYTLGEGDVLRRAMGKKDQAEMARQREKFKSGCYQNGISEEKATEIFDKVEKFASYGFNKSHAAAYGFLSYVTAYLKANYPSEWMAALMTCDRHDISKLSKFIREALAMGLKVLPPDVNEAGRMFMATAHGIRFAMNGIKGVGEGVVDAIIEERDKRGKFKSLYDFISRLDVRKVGKKACESLIEAGCFDFTGWTRDSLLAAVDPIYETSGRDQKEKSSGYMNFFDLMGEKSSDKYLKPPEVLIPSTYESRLLKEKELLGFFLTGHPMDKFKEVLNRLSCVSFSKIEELPHDSVVRSAFIVETVQVRFSSKSQKKFAILNISDGFLTYELPIWPELFESKSELIKENQLLFAVLQIDKREETLKLAAKWIADLISADEQMVAESDIAYDKAKMQIQRFNQAQAAAKNAPASDKPKKLKEEIKVETLKLEVDVLKLKMSHILRFKELFEKHRGPSPIEISFINGKDLKATLSIDSRWGVKNSEELKNALKKFDSCWSIN